jgi:hypothetical protein
MSPDIIRASHNYMRHTTIGVIQSVVDVVQTGRCPINNGLTGFPVRFLPCPYLHSGGLQVAS